MPELLTRVLGDLAIRVNYYDESERAKLLQYPASPGISAAVADGVRIPAAQFLTYYLYHRRRPGRLGYSTYYEISNKIDRAISDLEDWVSLEDGTVKLASSAGAPLDYMTEHLGEAIALVVLGQIHGLSEADWDRIPEHPGRNGVHTFDYEREVLSASDGSYVVQIEAKGTSVTDSSRAGANISAHARNIREKKESISKLETQGVYPHPASLRYGSIGIVGAETAECLLLDPPRPEELDPRRMRLLLRLQFIFNWIAFLGSRSSLAASFATRLSTLQALPDPFLLDRMPLLRGDGTPFDLYRIGGFGLELKLRARLSHVTDGPAVGKIFRLQSGRLLFLGIQGDLYDMVATQNFDAVLSYRNGVGTIAKTLRCVVPIGLARELKLTDSEIPTETAGGYPRFYASGLLQYAEGGTVFGIVKPHR